MQGICSVVCHMKNSEIILKSEIIPKHKKTHQEEIFQTMSKKDDILKESAVF